MTVRGLFFRYFFLYFFTSTGGPLEQTSNGELIGVASFIGIGPDKTCVLPEYGTVFAKISVARDWIEELTGV